MSLLRPQHATPWLLFALLCLSQPQIAQAADIQPGDNQLLPNIHWQDAQGNTYSLADSQGKSRILHFWAAWCVPCRKELPEMLQWQAANPDIRVIPLSLDQRMAQTRYFIRKYKLEMSPLLLNKGDHDALKIPALPYTLFVSAEGHVLARLIGIAAWHDAEFSARVRNIFATATPAAAD